MATIQRRMLGMATKFGTRMISLWPGTAVVSRRSGVRARKLGQDAYLISRRDLEIPKLATSARLLWNPEEVRANFTEFQKGAVAQLVREHVGWILRTYQVNCVIDAGAHKGGFAKSLRAAGYRGRIVSFEPVPHLVEELRQAAADDPEWWVYPYALGSADETTQMNVTKGTMSSLLPPSEFGRRRRRRFSKSTSQQIEVRRLDGLLDELFDGIDEPRPYLKMDTQGYDLQAFAGAGDSIERFAGMQSEMALLRVYEGAPTMKEALQTYEGAGFEISGLYPVSREQTTARLVEFDCLLVRAEMAPAQQGQDQEQDAGEEAEQN